MSFPYFSELILRAETKPFEQRTPLTPIQARELIAAGVKVQVESSSDRIYNNQDYQSVGCEIIASGSWKSAESDVVILGLKELEEESFPIKQNHIYFAHCYKGQSGSKNILERFRQGQGKLYDLEFLIDSNGRRVSAFGHWAGFVGAAIAVKQFYLSAHGKKLNKVFPWSNEQHLIDEITSLKSKNISAIVIGAKGRCGLGAIDALEKLGVQSISKWDLEETIKGGPFMEILDHDIFVNCVYLNRKIPPFITEDMLEKKSKLKVISDVSCDPTSPNNPIPLYEHITTFDEPRIELNEDVDLLAIDMLPSLLPLESSDDFTSQLFPHLKRFLLEGPIEEVFSRSFKIFETALNNTTHSGLTL